MWTEHEINIAKQLQDPTTLAFITKVFCEIQTSNGEELAQNVVALDDAEYGRIMKVYYLSKKENKAKLNLIAKISKMNAPDKKQVALAPR